MFVTFLVVAKLCLHPLLHLENLLELIFKLDIGMNCYFCGFNRCVNSGESLTN